MNKTKKQHGIMATIAIIAIGFALATCDDGKDDNQTEQPEYRTDTVTFVFEGSDSIYKAEVQGTMLLADWNNAKTAIKTKIESARNTTAVGAEKGRFNVFAENQNAVIIFDPNAGNGKYEVKDGEWNKLYINPSALNSITDTEIITAVTAMRGETTAKE